jgi:CheY-like chemotaxis protein
MNSQRILIIDDEAPLRYLLERQLCRVGFGVLEAVDGFAGISAALAHAPDLIILDLMMPGIDGFETFRRLRGDLRTADIPVVFLSGSVNGEMRRRAFAMGAADVLAKPHEVNDVVTVVEGILRRRAAASEPPARGRIVSLVGLAPGNASAVMGVQLSRMVALHSTWPVVLMDLDLARSPLASRLGLRRSPHILSMLHHSPVPMTAAEVAPYIQPQHSGLGVIVAPLETGQIDAASLPRLRAALDELRAIGYYVVIHLGHELTDLALSAMRGSDLVCALATRHEHGAYAAFVATAVDRGVNADKLVPVAGDMLETNKPRAARTTGTTAPRRPAHVPSGQWQALDLFL